MTRIRWWCTGVATVLVTLVVWRIAVPVVGIGSTSFPPPELVWFAAVEVTANGMLPAYLGDTLLRWGEALLIGGGLATAIRALPVLRRPAMQMARLLVPVPGAMWLLLGVTYGHGAGVLAGLCLVAALAMLEPQVGGRLAGLRSAAWRSLATLLLAEMVGAGDGLGSFLIESAYLQYTERALVGMFVLALLWRLLEAMYFRPLENPAPVVAPPWLAGAVLALLAAACALRWPELLGPLWSSLRHLAAGIVIGLALAMALRAAGLAERMIPRFLRAIPAIAWAPLGLTWFDPGGAAVVLVVAWAVTAAWLDDAPVLAPAAAAALAAEMVVGSAGIGTLIVTAFG